MSMPHPVIDADGVHCCACVVGAIHMTPDTTGCEWCDPTAVLAIGEDRSGQVTLILKDFLGDSTMETLTLPRFAEGKRLCCCGQPAAECKDARHH